MKLLDCETSSSVFLEVQKKVRGKNVSALNIPTVIR
jgi:hypothetical protein